MLRSKWIVLAILWLSLFVAYADRVNIAFAGPAMQSALHLQPWQFGTVLSAFSLGYALMQIPAGALADRFGAREVLIGAMLVWSAFTAAIGLSSSLTGLVGARIALGLGEGAENGAQFKLLGGVFSQAERSFSTGFFMTALAVAPAGVALIAHPIIAHLGWRALFLLFAIPGPIVALLLYRFVRATARTASARVAVERQPWGTTVIRSGAWLIGLAYFGFNIAFWSLLGWLPSYLANERHMGSAALAPAASFAYCAGFVGLLLVGWLGARFVEHRARIVAVSYTLAAVGLFAAFAAPDAHLSVLGLAFAAFFLYGGFGPLWAVVLDVTPRSQHGTVSGFVNFCGQIGGIVGPAAVGWIVQVTHVYDRGFELMIVGLAIAVIALSFVRSIPGSGQPDIYSEGHGHVFR